MLCDAALESAHLFRVGEAEERVVVSIDLSFLCTQPSDVHVLQIDQRRIKRSLEQALHYIDGHKIAGSGKILWIRLRLIHV